MTLDRLLAAEPDAWDSTFVVAVTPRVPITGEDMSRVKTTQEEVQLLEAAVKKAGSVLAFAKLVPDTRSPTAVAQQVRQMLKGKRATEPGRTLIMNTATVRPAELPEVIVAEGEPYVRVADEDVPHPALAGHVYEPKTVKVDDCKTIVEDLVEALRAVLLTEDSDQQGKYAAELQAAKLLLRLDR